jgi:outer membrane protein assembly factor BamA
MNLYPNFFFKLKLKNRIILLIIFFLQSFFISAQKNFSIKYYIRDSSNTELPSFKKVLDESNNFKDTLQVKRKIESVINDMRWAGFLAASVDSIHRDSLNTIVFLYVGDKYLWANVRQGNIPVDLLDGTGFRKKLFSGKPLHYEQIGLLNSKILNNCENNGYPFATIYLDSIELKENGISAALAINRNAFVHIDSIIIKGNSTVAPVYIYNYIGIKPGSIYRESQVRKLSSRFRELPFVKEVKQSQILFSEKETKLYLYLDNKKASQFDGVIGILPDESKSGKINVTGEVHLKLQNTLSRGEIIELNWKQLPVKSQDLKVHLLYPFLFSTPFGIDGSLAIYKRDSTYIDVIKNLGLQYALSGSNYLKAFILDKQSDLQSTDGLENITTLPPYADITTVSYGISIHYEKLDYRLNPRKGFSIEATGSTGNRTIRKNSDINPAVYDSLNLKSVTYQSELNGDFYLSLGGRHVVDFGGSTAYIYNADLFTNELYRIGGLKSLRGFDEESIYASRYVIGKIEYRYLLEQNSFLFTFINGAWYENKSTDLHIQDTPIGFGAGIDFETKIGIMSVSYALGKQFDNPILVKNGKIHFGIVNYF